MTEAHAAGSLCKVVNLGPNCDAHNILSDRRNHYKNCINTLVFFLSKCSWEAHIGKSVVIRRQCKWESMCVTWGNETYVTTELMFWFSAALLRVLEYSTVQFSDGITNVMFIFPRLLYKRAHYVFPQRKQSEEKSMFFLFYGVSGRISIIRTWEGRRRKQKL